MKSLLEIYSLLWEATKEKDERFIKETFIDLVYKDISPQLTIVDIGAFTGEFSFYCLPFAKRIYAIEPDPIPFKKMEEYIEIFEAQEIIKAFDCAIGAADGIRLMKLTQNGGGGFDTNGTEKIQTYSLDSFMKNNSIDYIDILKVDIEGGEREIFESEYFKDLVPKIGLIIGEHGGFEVLTKYGFEVERKEHGVFLATK